MEPPPPPPYTENGRIAPVSVEMLDWDTFAPYITPENVSPRIFYALRVLLRQRLDTFIISQSRDNEQKEIDLIWSQIY
jgi:hypothetical protein